MQLGNYAIQCLEELTMVEDHVEFGFVKNMPHGMHARKLLRFLERVFIE